MNVVVVTQDRHLNCYLLAYLYTNTMCSAVYSEILLGNAEMLVCSLNLID